MQLAGAAAMGAATTGATATRAADAGAAARGTAAIGGALSWEKQPQEQPIEAAAKEEPLRKQQPREKKQPQLLILKYIGLLIEPCEKTISLRKKLYNHRFRHLVFIIGSPFIEHLGYYSIWSPYSKHSHQ